MLSGRFHVRCRNTFHKINGPKEKENVPTAYENYDYNSCSEDLKERNTGMVRLQQGRREKEPK